MFVIRLKQGAESDMLCLVVRLLAQHRFQQTRLVVMLGSLDFFVLNDQDKAVSCDSGDMFDMMILIENHLGGLLRCSQISSHATSLQFLRCRWRGSPWEPAASK